MHGQGRLHRRIAASLSRPNDDYPWRGERRMAGPGDAAIGKARRTLRGTGRVVPAAPGVVPAGLAAAFRVADHERRGRALQVVPGMWP